MQISSNNTLPVTTGIPAETSLRRTASRPPSKTAVENQNQTTVANKAGSEKGSRRPPVFVQSMKNVQLSRTGEEAMRAYRDVAQAGDQAELVNRVNVIA
jgi:hypothetical protein